MNMNAIIMMGLALAMLGGTIHGMRRHPDRGWQGWGAVSGFSAGMLFAINYTLLDSPNYGPSSVWWTLSVVVGVLGLGGAVAYLRKKKGKS